jgi:hypothetical protein
MSPNDVARCAGSISLHTLSSKRNTSMCTCAAHSPGHHSRVTDCSWAQPHLQSSSLPSNSVRKL